MSILDHLDINTSELPDEVKANLSSERPDTTIAGQLFGMLTDAFEEAGPSVTPKFTIDDAIILAHAVLGLTVKRTSAATALRTLVEQGKVTKVAGTKSTYVLGQPVAEEVEAA